jgi:hypothetical protein
MGQNGAKPRSRDVKFLTENESKRSVANLIRTRTKGLGDGPDVVGETVAEISE